MNFSADAQQKYPQILWITLWIAPCILRKPVLALILSLVLPNFSATHPHNLAIAPSNNKK